MKEPDLLDARRAAGIDADDEEVRAVVRVATSHTRSVARRTGSLPIAAADTEEYRQSWGLV